MENLCDLLGFLFSKPPAGIGKVPVRSVQLASPITVPALRAVRATLQNVTTPNEFGRLRKC